MSLLNLRCGTRRACFLLALLSPLSFAPPALAQVAPGAPRSAVEVWGGLTRALPTSGGELRSTYSPPMLGGETPIRSSASQTLTVDTAGGTGVEAGINVFPGRGWLGVQFFASRTRTDVEGVNGPYDVLLRYVSRQPPDYVAQEFTFTSSTDWADTTGWLRDLSVAAGGVARWESGGGGAGGSAAGGVSFERITGEIESVGYTAFRLGGHSVLFPFQHRVVVGPSDEDFLIRPYAAADVHVRVATHAALFVGARVRFGQILSVPMRVVRLVDPADAPTVPELDAVERDLALTPMELPGVRWQVFGGIKVFIG